ncbi:MAG TPA: phosphatase, partial [Armatimonadetes bacterium]|nr:phosphatase [Armatimonadota bacterium]
MQRADLHTHTTFSDGTLTPAEVIAQARDIGLA